MSNLAYGARKGWTWAKAARAARGARSSAIPMPPVGGWRASPQAAATRGRATSRKLPIRRTVAISAGAGAIFGGIKNNTGPAMDPMIGRPRGIYGR